MARKGTPKWFSQIHEEFLAHRFGGRRSPSSGGHISDQGDVRTDKYLIEAKHTGSYNKPAKSITIKLETLEKICDEAWSEGRTPMLALRMYNPDSVLSDASGMIDLIVRLERDERN